MVSEDRRRLVGREHELVLLERAFEDAQASRGRAFLIAGDAGIGKTTLVEAFSTDLQERGAGVAWGRCWEAGGAPAYWPWVQALRGLLAVPGVLAALDPARAFLDVVATLIPEIAGPGTARKPQAIEGDSERFALFDAISRVIQTIAAHRPVVIVLDDLHAADVSSLLLLKFIARDIRASRCLVVGIYREREAQSDSTLSALLMDVAREGEEINLSGLDTKAFDGLLGRVAGTPPSDALVASLHQVTDGNPFYATEIVRLLLREGQVEPRLDLTRRGLPVPENVSDIVLRRLSDVDREVREILKIASVIGREFSLWAVAAASELSPLEVRSRLSVAERERIVRTTGSGTYAFDHGLIREALYDALPDADRAALHGKVAAALEAVGVDAAGESLTEIAHHYLKAARDDARPPFEYASRAAARALEVFAYEQAIHLFEEAMALAPVVKATPTERTRLLRGTGEALLRAGRITEAKERLLAAAESALEAGSPEDLVAAAITFGHVPVEGGIVNQEHIQLIREALKALPEGPSPERALLLARWAHELMLSGNAEDVGPRDRMSAEALQMISAFDDEKNVARVLRNRFSVILAPDRLDECLAVADRILGIGLRTRDEEVEIIGRIRRAGIFMCQGRAAEMDAEFDAIQRLQTTVRQPMFTSPAAFFKACLVGMRRDPDTATKQSDAAMALGPDVPNAMAAHLLQHIAWRWQTDGAADFEPFMRVAMEQRPGIRRTWRAAVAATLARVGRRDEARALVHDTIEDLPNAPVDSTYMALLYCVTEAMRVMRDGQGAEVVYKALLPYRDQHISQIMVAPVIYYGAVEWHLGTLASLSNRSAEAQEHLEAALRHHARMGARAYLAWTQVELAEVLSRRETLDDRARAAALFEEGTQTAESLGMRVLSDWAGDVSAAAGPMEARNPPNEPASSAAEMRREGEYVTIRCRNEIVRLRQSKGLVYLGALLSAPGREVHVLDIASARTAASDGGEKGVGIANDDVGAVLDPKAKAAYKVRVEELRADIEEAESFNDAARAAQAREELEFLTRELAAAIGLGGRDRKPSSDVERARVNVTKRIKTTLDKIAEGAPHLGRHLEATVKTGTYLTYSDRLEQTFRWTVSLD